jgi:hypothetical protein
MIESATHLVEDVLPLVPYRQFVLSLPIPLRYWINANKKLSSKVHRITTKAVHRYYTSKAKQLGVKNPKPGSITFTQRWGSALNLNPHQHILTADGVYTTVNGALQFRNLAAITNDEVAALLTQIASRIMRHLKKTGYLNEEGELVENPTNENDGALFSDSESMKQATSASVRGMIAFGPNAGKYVTKIGSGFGYAEEVPVAKGQRCFTVNGFSLHANTSTNTHQRDRLSKLIEYMARGPLSNERLEITDTGQVKLKLKTRWVDGTSHLLFTPGEFIEKLAALVPPPRIHLVRWSGVFAPNSPYRKTITLKPENRKAKVRKAEKNRNCSDSGSGADASTKPKTLHSSAWSRMLAQVFKIDVTICKKCGGDLAVVCAVNKGEEIARYLKHAKIDYEPPARAPPRLRQEEILDFADEAFDDQS